MRRVIAALALVLAACSGGDLSRLAAETCAILDDPATSAAARSLVVYESTTKAIELGYAEEEFAGALRSACGDSVIIGGEG